MTIGQIPITKANLTANALWGKRSVREGEEEGSGTYVTVKHRKMNDTYFKKRTYAFDLY